MLRALITTVFCFLLAVSAALGAGTAAPLADMPEMQQMAYDLQWGQLLLIAHPEDTATDSAVTAAFDADWKYCVFAQTVHTAITDQKLEKATAFLDWRTDFTLKEPRTYTLLIKAWSSTKQAFVTLVAMNVPHENGIARKMSLAEQAVLFPLYCRVLQHKLELLARNGPSTESTVRQDEAICSTRGKDALNSTPIVIWDRMHREPLDTAYWRRTLGPEARTVRSCSSDQIESILSAKTSKVVMLHVFEQYHFYDSHSGELFAIYPSNLRNLEAFYATQVATNAPEKITRNHFGEIAIGSMLVMALVGLIVATSNIGK